MKESTTREILGSAERNAILAKCLHQHLKVAGLPTLAMEAWVIYLGASQSVETMGNELGVDVEKP